MGGTIKHTELQPLTALLAIPKTVYTHWSLIRIFPTHMTDFATWTRLFTLLQKHDERKWCPCHVLYGRADEQYCLTQDRCGSEEFRGREGKHMVSMDYVTKWAEEYGFPTAIPMKQPSILRHLNDTMLP